MPNRRRSGVRSVCRRLPWSHLENGFPSLRFTYVAVSLGVALAAGTVARSVGAQTAAAIPPWSPPALHIEFSTPQPMELRLAQGSPFPCQGVCRVELAPGGHRLDARPPATPDCTTSGARSISPPMHEFTSFREVVLSTNGESVWSPS